MSTCELATVGGEGRQKEVDKITDNAAAPLHKQAARRQNFDFLGHFLAIL
jgi:hypothetical protein